MCSWWFFLVALEWFIAIHVGGKTRSKRACLHNNNNNNNVDHDESLRRTEGFAHTSNNRLCLNVEIMSPPTSKHFHFDGVFLSVLAEKRAAYLLPTAAARKQVRNAHGRATSRTNRLIHRSSQSHASSKSGAFAPARRFKGPRRREKHVASARARFLTGLLI